MIFCLKNRSVSCGLGKRRVDLKRNKQNTQINLTQGVFEIISDQSRIDRGIILSISNTLEGGCRVSEGGEQRGVQM